MILPAFEANQVLRKAGIPVVHAVPVATRDDALREAAVLGYPSVLKISSGRFPHKTEIGGVALDLKTSEEVLAAFERLDSVRKTLDPDALIVMECMAPSGAEFFVGIQRHAEFGPVMSVGFGGVWLELFEDVSFRLLPATNGDLREMLSELKCWAKLKNGFRHLRPVDESSLVAFLRRIGRLALERVDLLEMDLNPIVLLPEGPMVLDARIVSKDPD
jgi:succinyl-CoA synthetase beta subunit